MRFLFCSFASPGYLYPLTGLALELRARGHQVAFATGPEARPVLEAAEIERIPRGAADGESFRVGVWWRPLAAAIDLKHVEHAAARFAPDALVTHPLCQGALLARERGRIPTAVLGFFAYLWPSPGGSGGAEANRRWRLGECVRIMNGARALFSLPPLAGGDPAPFLGDLWMLRSVPRLVPELPALPARVHAVGACAWEPAADAAAGWSALRPALARPGAPLVYAQPGRTFDGPGFWPQLVEALGGGPLQVVASTGRLDQEAGPIPPNFVARPHVPQGVVARRARVVVSSGSTAPVLAALAHGVPQVVIPSGGETPDNAARLAAAGCALRLPVDGLTPAALRRAVDEAMDSPGMAAAARRLRRDFAAAAGFSAAAGLVERLAAGRSVARAPHRSAPHAFPEASHAPV